MTEECFASSMALALIAVVFTATAIGTVFHDKY